MKIEMLLLFITVVGLVAVPYILFLVLGHGNTKKLSKKIHEEALKNNLKVDQEEYWSLRHIALDTANKQLLFAELLENELRYEQVDLKSLSRIVIQEDQLPSTSGQNQQGRLKSLNLIFYTKNTEAPVVINFYDYERDIVQDYEVKRINRWKVLIEQQLLPAWKPAKAA
ncbi:MAG: hypothetical protein WBG71_06105 [Leeuwenhoekiella sp.]